MPFFFFFFGENLICYRVCLQHDIRCDGASLIKESPVPRFYMVSSFGHYSSNGTYSFSLLKENRTFFEA